MTRKQIEERMVCDPEAGTLTWREGSTRVGELAGKEVGCLNGDGYRVVNLDGRLFRVHRLIWLYAHGTFPKFLDHRDGNRSNNKISNLRRVTKSQNNWNGKTPHTNTSGAKGVTQYGSAGKWRACVTKHGKQYCRAGFETFEQAKAAAQSLRLTLHGEFSHNG